MPGNCRINPTLSIGINLFDPSSIRRDKSDMDVDTVHKRIGANLQSLMEEKGLNPSRWAKDSGMGHTGVRDIITGKTKTPTYRTLLRLAASAGVDVQRITVGPNYLDADQERAEILDLLLQLEPGEREILLTAARVRIDAKASEHQESPADDE